MLRLRGRKHPRYLPGPGNYHVRGHRILRPRRGFDRPDADHHHRRRGGDIVYYNPLDSITIIYEETSSVPTLTKMGEITSDLSAFENLPDKVDMRIERG